MSTHDRKNNQVSATICSNCGTTTTPLWRRAPNGDTICNACGLYLKARNTLRPPSMKRNFKKQQQQQQQEQVPSTPRMGTCPGNGQCNGTGGSPSCEGCPAFNQHQVNRNTALICANCRTTTTPLWRRDEQGNTICNACGLYYKLHHVHRPVSMKRSVIKRRKRIIVTGEEHEEQDELESESESEEQQEQEEPTPVLQAIVPPIEDYIVPKRATAFQEYRRSQSENTMSTHTLSYRLPPPPPPPPRTPPPPPPPPQLPSLKRFDPLYDYRQNPYKDLQEFDHAMTRLERLRRRVSPEQTALLSKLTHSLQDIVGQAEHILSCHNYN